MFIFIVTCISVIIACFVSLMYIAITTDMPPVFPTSDDDREGPLSSRWVDWLIERFGNPDTGKCFIYDHFVPESTKWARRKKRITSDSHAHNR